VSERGPVVGIDVGATKIAAGVVDPASGAVTAERRRGTPRAQGGAAVLAACRELADELAPKGAAAVGIGLCELVDLNGRPASGLSIDWRGLDVAGAFRSERPAVLESDVRAAAVAEARFGAGAAPAASST
jgi:glucokinase